MGDTSVVIGNYNIISIIASGSFGRVYLARHRILTTRLVALKLMHTVPFASMREREQFVQEAQVLELLKHPSILPILDVGMHEGMPYIVSEYAVGGSLRDRLQDQDKGPLSLEEAIAILSQLGQALQYAHDQHIIHRDIKPENILFNAQGHVLLADFGLATVLATASVKSVNQAGTPRYMAPEQFQEQACKESDQYALGCVAYELFTGSAPFLASEPIALFYQHVNVPPVSLREHNPQLPEYIEQAVLKALMKQRADRYRDIQAFVAALQPPGSLQPLDFATTPISELSVQQEGVARSSSLASALHINAELEKHEALAEDEAYTLPSLRAQASSSNVITQYSSGSADVSHPLSAQATPWHSSAINGLSFSFFLKYKAMPRSFLAISCIVLIAIVSSSVLWVTHAASSIPGHTQGSDLSRHSVLAAHSLSTPTVQPAQKPTQLSATPTQSPTVQPTSIAQVQPTSIPQLASVSRSQPTPTTQSAPAFQPTPTVQHAPVAQHVQKSSYAMSYYICGDHVVLTNSNAWNAVQANATVHASQYSGPVNGYAGPAGNPKNSPGNCSGFYQWAWNQTSVQAQWMWSNAHLPDGICNVSVHIPSWYAGAPDAHYVLTATPNAGDSTTYAFDTQNQNQAVTTWIDLHINGQVPLLALPSSSDGIYTLTLTMQNGGTPNWYLGADAIRFNCSSSMPQ